MKRYLPFTLILCLSLLRSSADADSLRAQVNVDGRNIQTHRDKQERLSYDVVLTDVQVPATAAQPYAEWQEAIGAIKANAPSAPAGSYISSRLARDKRDMIHFPPECVLLRHFSPSEYMPQQFQPTTEPGRAIDFRQPVARAKLITLIVNEATFRSRPVLLTDNWAHPVSWHGFIPWRDSIDYMRGLRAPLNERGIKLYVNLATAFGFMPDEDVKALAENCDGVTLEQVLVPATVTEPGALAKLAVQYRVVLDKGVRVIFIPGNADPMQARFYAGLAMVLQTDAGFTPLVAWPVTEENQPWHMWPDQFGKPTDKIKIDGHKISRRFERGGIEVDCKARTAAANLSVSSVNPVPQRLDARRRSLSAYPIPSPAGEAAHAQIDPLIRATAEHAPSQILGRAICEPVNTEQASKRPFHH